MVSQDALSSDFYELRGLRVAFTLLGWAWGSWGPASSGKAPSTDRKVDTR